MLLCTEPFFAKAGIEAREGGLADLERLAMPHRLHHLDEAGRRALAAELAAEAVRRLRGVPA